MSDDNGFELSAHFLDRRRTVSAGSDGYGWIIRTEAGELRARNIDEAIRIAQQHIGELLRRVGRRPGWGLRVGVESVAASYGEPDPEAMVMPGGRADPNSLVARIRGRWREGDSAVAALDNALEIVRAYAGRRRRGLAA